MTMRAARVVGVTEERSRPPMRARQGASALASEEKERRIPYSPALRATRPREGIAASVRVAATSSLYLGTSAHKTRASERLYPAGGGYAGSESQGRAKTPRTWPEAAKTLRARAVGRSTNPLKRSSLTRRLRRGASARTSTVASATLTRAAIALCPKAWAESLPCGRWTVAISTQIRVRPSRARCCSAARVGCCPSFRKVGAGGSSRVGSSVTARAADATERKLTSQLGGGTAVAPAGKDASDKGAANPTADATRTPAPQPLMTELRAGWEASDIQSEAASRASRGMVTSTTTASTTRSARVSSSSTRSRSRVRWEGNVTRGRWWVPCPGATRSPQA